MNQCRYIPNWTLGHKFHRKRIKLRQCSTTKIPSKVPSVKCLPFCSCFDVFKCLDFTQMTMFGSLTFLFRCNSTISQIPQCVCLIFRNTPLRIEMYIFLACMVHCGIWYKCNWDLWIWAIITVTWYEFYMASKITSNSAICSTACSANNRENIKAPYHKPFVREIHWKWMDSPH